MNKEELSKLAKENCRDIADATDYVDSAAYDGIIFGAEAEKKYLLEKAVNWLLDNSKKYIIATGAGFWYDDIRLRNDFIKAMEK